MALHPQCRALLDSFVAAWPKVDFDKVTATEWRAMFAGPSPFAPGDEVARIEDTVIPGPGGDLRLRVYRPKAASDRLPVTLYFHGGGFVSGPIEGHDNICGTLAQRASTLVVSVDYRLAPECKFPGATLDAMAALSWVAEHAADIGGDPSNVAVAGDSAGANLATVLAGQAATAGILLRHQLLIYPVIDASMSTNSFEEFGEGYLLTKHMMRWYWKQYLPEPGDKTNPLPSPFNDPTLVHQPSATILLAEFDPLRDEGRMYADALARAGVSVTIREWPGQIHGFVSMLGALDDANLALDGCATALRSAFNTQAGTSRQPTSA